MDINCAPCHERIEHARQTLHEDIATCLAHHGLKAEVKIRLLDDERLSDSGLSHLDRFMQWALEKTGRAAA